LLKLKVVVKWLPGEHVVYLSVSAKLTFCQLQVSEDGELRAVLAVVDEDNDAITIWVEPRALDPTEVHSLCLSLFELTNLVSPFSFWLQG
jgi:hypothetical protein